MIRKLLGAIFALTIVVSAAYADTPAGFQSVDYGNASVTASYTKALTNSSYHLFKLCWFFCTMDANARLSLDGTNDGPAIPCSSTGFLSAFDVGADQRVITTDLYVKRLSGAPTTGSLYISCMY